MVTGQKSYDKSYRAQYDVANRKGKARTWTKRKSNMITGYRILGVDNILHKFPGALRCVVSDPVHQILEFQTMESGIEDRFNLELGHPVHMDGERDLHDSAGERVRHVRLQEVDMEHRMDVHVRREVEPAGKRSDRTNDGEWSRATDIQLG